MILKSTQHMRHVCIIISYIACCRVLLTSCRLENLSSSKVWARLSICKNEACLTSCLMKVHVLRPVVNLLCPRLCTSPSQMVVSSYEARQQELMQDNKGLQAALADLQSDYQALANKQAAAQQLQAAAVRGLAEEEDFSGRLQTADTDEVQAELTSKMAAMKSKLEGIYDGPLQQVPRHSIICLVRATCMRYAE